MDHTHTLPFLSIIPYKFKMFLLDNTFLIPIFLFISIYCILSKLSDMTKSKSARNHKEDCRLHDDEYIQDHQEGHESYSKRIFRDPKSGRKFSDRF